jgi:hypothetical protein
VKVDSKSDHLLPRMPPVGLPVSPIPEFPDIFLQISLSRISLKSQQIPFAMHCGKKSTGGDAGPK